MKFDKNIVNAINPVTNTTGGITTMKTKSVNLVINTPNPVSVKRVSYSETTTKAIISAIKNGANFAYIRKKFNVKTPSTIKSWLGRYYPVKKALADKYWEMLLDNNNIEKSITYSDWFGSEEPDFDVLIDSRMDVNHILLAKQYCRVMNLSWKMSTKENSVNIQALAYGKPLVISDVAEPLEYCEIDNVPSIHIKSLLKFQEEVSDIQFSKTIKFKSLKRGINGIYSGYTVQVIEEFKSLFAFEGRLELYLDDRLPPERFGLKEGKYLIFVGTDKDRCYCWKLQLVNGAFHETLYREGFAFMKDNVIKGIA